METRNIDYKKLYNDCHKQLPAYVQYNHGVVLIPFWKSHFKFNSFLEIGCGNGKLCKILARRGIKVTGVDVTSFPYDRSAYEYICMDVTKEPLPFMDKTFDLAAAFDVFEHFTLSDLSYAVKEFIRVAKVQVVKVPHVGDHSGKGRTLQLHEIIENSQWWLDYLNQFSEVPWTVCEDNPTTKYCTLYFRKV